MKVYDGGHPVKVESGQVITHGSPLMHKECIEFPDMMVLYREHPYDGSEYDCPACDKRIEVIKVEA